MWRQMYTFWSTLKKLQHVRNYGYPFVGERSILKKFCNFRLAIQSNFCTSNTLGIQTGPQICVRCLLIGGRCWEVALCYKNWKWDPKIVVAVDKLSLLEVVVNSGLTVYSDSGFLRSVWNHMFFPQKPHNGPVLLQCPPLNLITDNRNSRLL